MYLFSYVTLFCSYQVHINNSKMTDESKTIINIINEINYYIKMYWISDKIALTKLKLFNIIFHNKYSKVDFILK